MEHNLQLFVEINFDEENYQALIDLYKSREKAMRAILEAFAAEETEGWIPRGYIILDGEMYE